MTDSLKSMKFATVAVAAAGLGAGAVSAKMVTPPAATPIPFTPYYDRILLKKVDASDEQPAAATIPSYALTAGMQAVDRPRLFEVVAVGPGRAMEFEPSVGVVSVDTALATRHCLVPLLSSPGDKVYVGKHAGAGNEIKIAGAEYLVVKEEEILGRVGG